MSKAQKNRTCCFSLYCHGTVRETAAHLEETKEWACSFISR